uniref:(northern house mosquito) hypothetical protein n=1 Tax=Culex pipiens TaxID=7175 RepID=A0A8D8J1E3_CULPI
MCKGVLIKLFPLKSVCVYCFNIAVTNSSKRAWFHSASVRLVFQNISKKLRISFSVNGTNECANTFKLLSSLIFALLSRVVTISFITCFLTVFRKFKTGSQ